MMGKNKSPYARVVIGSVFGVFFFSFWQFFKYYSTLYHWSELHIQATFIVLSVVATLSSALLVRVKYDLIVAIASFSIFALCMLVTYSEEVQIKNEIAIISGYFDNKQIKPSNHEPISGHNTFTHTIGGYQVSIPPTWQLRVDKGQAFKYYQLMHDDVLMAEFRPKCFQSDQVALTDVAAALLTKPSSQLLKPGLFCGFRKTLIYFCRIDEYKASNKIKRINWLGIRKSFQKGVDLDFVLHEPHPDVLPQIDGIIASLQPTRGANSGATCLGLSEWF